MKRCLPLFLACTLLAACQSPPKNYPAPIHRTNVIAGTILSDSGQPLSDVQIKINFLADPGRGRYDHATRITGPTFRESATGEIWDVSFSHDGYYTKTFYCNGTSLVLSSEGGHEQQPTGHPRPSQPAADLHIVLRKQGPLVTVQHHMETLWIDSTGAGAVMDPALPATAWDSLLFTPDVDQAPAGYFYLSAARDARGIRAQPALHREKYPTFKPAEIRLGIAHAPPGEGIQLLPVTDEADLWFQMLHAPTSGYQPQITLDPASIQRLANNERLYFFLKSRGIYSAGSLTDWSLEDFRNDHFTHYGIRAYVTTQPNGTPNFETGD